MDKSLPRAGSRARELRAYGWGLLFVAMVYLFLANGLALDLFEHSAHDSYTLQAMRWREGHIALAQDYDWLELAYYDGGIYVSFPPFPTVPMLLLTFLFPGDTMLMVVSAIGLVLFAAMTVHDAQQTRAIFNEYAGYGPEMIKKVSIICALNLYLDFVNIFLYILQLLGNRD